MTMAVKLLHAAGIVLVPPDDVFAVIMHGESLFCLCVKSNEVYDLDRKSCGWVKDIIYDAKTHGGCLFFRIAEEDDKDD